MLAFMSIFTHPINTLRGDADHPGRSRGRDPAARQRGVEVRADAAVHRPGAAAADLRRSWLQRASGSRATSSVGRSRAAPRRSRRSARRPTACRSRCTRRSTSTALTGTPSTTSSRRSPTPRATTATSAGTSRSSSSTRRHRHPLQPDGRAGGPDAGRRHRGRPAAPDRRRPLRGRRDRRARP